jgi:hypothetical protein
VKRAWRWLLWGWPAVLLAGLAVPLVFEVHRTDALLTDPNGLTWGEGPGAICVAVTRTEDGEILRFDIEARRASGTPVLERQFLVNRDTWGDGFVRAAQVDDDPELEVVAWGHHEEGKTDFWLDHAGDGVEERPFAVASERARALARAWHQSHKVDPVALVVVAVLACGYYFVLLLVWGLVRLLRRAGPSPPPAGA